MQLPPSPIRAASRLVAEAATASSAADGGGRRRREAVATAVAARHWEPSQGFTNHAGDHKKRLKLGRKFEFAHYQEYASTPQLRIIRLLTPLRGPLTAHSSRSKGHLAAEPASLGWSWRTKD